MTNSFTDLVRDNTRPSMASGDAAALLRQWFMAHFRTVGRALAWFGVSSGEDRLDLTQDVFVAAYLAVLRGDQIDNPRAWLRECARKHASNHRHKEVRRARPTGEAPAGPGQDPEQIATDRERLRRAFASLDEDAQALVFDVRADEMSWGEVARERGLSVNQARYLYQRALTQMEAVLKRDDAGEKESRAVGPPIVLLEGRLRAEADDVSPDARGRIWDSIERRIGALPVSLTQTAPPAPRLELGATLGLLGGGIAIGIVIGYLLRGPPPHTTAPGLVARAAQSVLPGEPVAVPLPLSVAVAVAPPDPSAASTSHVASLDLRSLPVESRSKGISTTAPARGRSGSGSMSLLDRARAAIASGDALAGIALLAEHAKQFPDGQDAGPRSDLLRLACARPVGRGARECALAPSGAPPD